MVGVRWAYGVTTVESRLNTTLPMTLDSLDRGGFPDPRLFVDDDKWFENSTSRNPKIGAYGNWMLRDVGIRCWPL